MRKRWIYVDGNAIPEEEFVPDPQADYHVMGDIEPFRAMTDGSMIMGRRQKRENYRAHNVIEIGDQVHALKKYERYQRDGSVKKALIEQVQAYKESKRTGRKYG